MNYRVYRYTVRPSNTGLGDKVEYGAHPGGTQELQDALKKAMDDDGSNLVNRGTASWFFGVLSYCDLGLSMTPATFYGRVVIEDAPEVGPDNSPTECDCEGAHAGANSFSALHKSAEQLGMHIEKSSNGELVIHTGWTFDDDTESYRPMTEDEVTR